MQSHEFRGLENFYKLDNKSPYQGAYVPFLDEQWIEGMAARAKEMAERKAVLSDEQLKKIQEQAEFQAQRQIEMAERYREMNAKYRWSTHISELSWRQHHLLFRREKGYRRND